VLTTTTPIKFVVLNTGSYSNTGGQASTASFTAQDSDLSRFGATHSGKQERRKELGLIAAFHPAVFVIQTSAALQGHFLKHVMSFFSHNDSPALLDVYTTCQSEHGIADDGATRRARLAVESRMNPVFVHDPGAGDTLAERFSLQGNPEVDKDWAKGRLEYLDDDGNSKIKEFPLTPADFAVNEGRFKKHFKPLRDEGGAVPVHRYVGLDVAERHGKHPYIWSTDSERRLVMLAVSPSIIALTEERLANWRMLQYLSGLHVVRLQEHHRRQLEEWQQKYQHMAQDREHSMDVIASGMSELAAISSAPALAGQAPVTIAVTAISSAASKATPKEHGHSAQMGLPLVSIAAEDMPKCTDCKACYQDLGELFEKTSIMAESGPKQVSRVKPGILDTIELTPELIDRASRIADECDAEIIRFCRP
jgi:pyruvate-ferredoxin/flavodoxin oxidoreductase